jgi:hypothetical protein
MTLLAEPVGAPPDPATDLLVRINQYDGTCATKWYLRGIEIKLMHDFMERFGVGIASGALSFNQIDEADVCAFESALAEFRGRDIVSGAVRQQRPEYLSERNNTNQCSTGNKTKENTHVSSCQTHHRRRKLLLVRTRLVVGHHALHCLVRETNRLRVSKPDVVNDLPDSRG